MGEKPSMRDEEAIERVLNAPEKPPYRPPAMPSISRERAEELLAGPRPEPFKMPDDADPIW